MAWPPVTHQDVTDEVGRVATTVDTGRLSDAELRAASVAAVEAAATVAPTGAWDFTTAPTVNGTALGSGGGGSGITAGTVAGQIPVWDGDSYEPQTPDEVTAADIAFTPAGTVAATTVQAAIEEVAAEAGGGGYTDEQVRDVIGATLVAGENVTLTPNDAGDTVTITATASGGGGATAYPRNPHPQAQNLKGWSYDPVQGLATPMGAGFAYFTKIPVPDQASVSEIIIAQTAVLATGATDARALLIASDGTIIGQTASQVASWEGSTGEKAMALTGGPFTVGGGGPTDFVYVAFGFSGGGSGMSALSISPTNSGANVGLAAGAYRYGQMSGQTFPLTGPITLTSLSQPASPKYYWAAIR